LVNAQYRCAESDLAQRDAAITLVFEEDSRVEQSSVEGARRVEVVDGDRDMVDIRDCRHTPMLCRQRATGRAMRVRLP
jgi:hypothetical protein